jgi:hypothetical protein
VDGFTKFGISSSANVNRQVGSSGLLPVRWVTSYLQSFIDQRHC